MDLEHLPSHPNPKILRTMDITDEAQAFTRNLRARGRSEVTVTTYLKAVHQLEGYLGDATDVTTQIIEKFLNNARARGMSPVTLAQRFRSLQQFFKYVAAETGEPNPMAGMHPPKHEVKPPDIPSPAEIRALLATCAGASFEDRRDLAILSIFADTGIRRGEMAGLRLHELDTTEQVLVVSGKTGTRGVPYGAETANRIDRYLRLRRKHPEHTLPWLWLGRKGRFTAFGIEGVVSARGRQAGLAIHCHILRHWFAHTWLDQGGNEGDLQKIAGWRSSQMIQRYGASAASARARRAYMAGRSPIDKLRV